MRCAKRPGMSVWAALAALGAMCCLSALTRAAPDIAGAASDGSVTGAWQHHKVTLNYVGFTSSFTCDGLESHVRQILLQLGARHDLKVRASGCPGPYNTPSHTAWVDVDFYALAPAADANGAGSVKARWSPLELTPRRPGFMDDGDCELMQGMKDLITQNFSLRDVEYRTECVPHQVTVNGFAVKGQALKAMSVDPGAA